ncbi:MAG: signal transduction histidine kinase [Candidatus Paceibacteria bacterium]|jgi:signal transduction histidine kinase
MISRILYILQRGWKQVTANSKLLFIAMVLFVFPLLFVLVLQQIDTVATANIQTAEFKRTDALHTAISGVITTVPEANLNQLLGAIADNASDVTTLRLYKSTLDNDVVIVASADRTELDEIRPLSTVLQLGKVEPQQTFAVPLTTTAGRIEQAVRYIEIDAVGYYIFSEHSRVQSDAVIEKRKQDSLLVLTLIFGFLIGLAYWINRQSDWQKKHNRLQTILEERDLFTNMIAHEFRTPLTAIKGYASFLQESETLTKEELRFSDTIRESAERLVLLVNDFLEIARIQSGKLTVEQKLIDIRKPIETVVASLLEEAKSKDLQLVYTPDLQPQILETDENRFVQILTNIVSNSIKYTDTGTIEISCESGRSEITIRVKDTGTGISAEDQQKLFVPFSRVGGVEKTATTGTGLGMWITKQMIELLRGDIAVESIKDVGTHVVMHFKHSKH